MMNKKMLVMILFVISWTINAKTNLSFFHGLWIDEGYDYILRSSHSPLAASHTTIIPAISIDTGSKELAISYNFHETTGAKIVSFDNKSCKIGLDIKDNILSCSNGTLFFSHYDYEKTFRNRDFVKISEKPNDNVYDGVSKYATPLVIDGEFKDSNGKIFGFKNNEANWPNGRFRWLIILDCVEFNPIDVFCEADSNQNCKKTIGFVTNGGILQFYEYDYNRKTIGPLLYDLLKRE